MSPLESLAQSVREAVASALHDSLTPDTVRDAILPTKPLPIAQPLSSDEREELRQLREARDAILPILQQCGVIPQDSTIQLTARGAYHGIFTLAARMNAAQADADDLRRQLADKAKVISSLEEKVKLVASSLKTLVAFAQNYAIDASSFEDDRDDGCDNEDYSDLEAS